MFRRRTQEPVPSTAATWRDIANLALELAHGRSHDWAMIRRLRRQAQGCDVFGQGGEDNPCAQLLAIIDMASLSADVHVHFDEMTRLATEVKRRYSAWYSIYTAGRRA